MPTSVAPPECGADLGLVAAPAKFRIFPKKTCACTVRPSAQRWPPAINKKSPNAAKDLGAPLSSRLANRLVTQSATGLKRPNSAGRHKAGTGDRPVSLQSGSLQQTDYGCSRLRFTSSKTASGRRTPIISNVTPVSSKTILGIDHQESLIGIPLNDRRIIHTSHQQAGLSYGRLRFLRARTPLA